MYLPSPYGPDIRPPEHPALAAIAECRRSGPATLRRYWKLLATWLGADDLAYARRLCRRLNPDAWEALLLVFIEALIRSQLERPQHLVERDRALDPRWAFEPWMFLSPQRFRGAHLEDLEEVLAYAADLGFRNVALGFDVGPELAVGGAGRLEHFVRSGDHRRLRLALGVDFSGAHDPSEPWLRADLHQPEVLQRLLATLSAELNLGILGTRTHAVDRWLDRDHPDDVHALQALIKLFVRLVSSKEILIPELEEPQHGRSPSRYVGGGISVHGERTSSEGDLVHWPEAMAGLRHLLANGDKARIERALMRPPDLLHGAGLLVSLEHHDRPGPRLAQLCGRDPARIALGVACLYFVPAIPVVYAASEMTLTDEQIDLERLALARTADDPVSSTLLALHDLLSFDRAPTTETLATGSAALAWQRHDELCSHLLLANPTDERQEVRLERGRAPTAMDVVYSRPDALLTTVGGAKGLAVSLEPGGFAILRAR